MRRAALCALQHVALCTCIVPISPMTQKHARARFAPTRRFAGTSVRAHTHKHNRGGYIVLHTHSRITPDTPIRTSFRSSCKCSRRRSMPTRHDPSRPIRTAAAVTVVLGLRAHARRSASIIADGIADAYANLCAVAPPRIQSFRVQPPLQHAVQCCDVLHLVAALSYWNRL